MCKAACCICISAVAATSATAPPFAINTMAIVSLSAAINQSMPDAMLEGKERAEREAMVNLVPLWHHRRAHRRSCLSTIVMPLAQNSVLPAEISRCADAFLVYHHGPMTTLIIHHFRELVADLESDGRSATAYGFVHLSFSYPHVCKCCRMEIRV